MHAYTDPEFAGRVHPKVPGLNAQPLGPSIGCDNWRTDSRQPRNIRPKTKVAPISGRGRADFGTGRNAKRETYENPLASSFLIVKGRKVRIR